MKNDAIGIDWNVWPSRFLRNCAMTSALGDSLGSGVGALLMRWPSRVKMRISMPPASAIRANTGTSRRQSDDQSSEMTSTRPGASGWAAIQASASRWAGVSCAASYALRKKSP